MRSGVYAIVGCPSVCLSHPTAARRRCGFAAVGPTSRRYRSIAARPAVSSSSRAAANAGSGTLSADVVKPADTDLFSAHL